MRKKQERKADYKTKSRYPSGKTFGIPAFICCFDRKVPSALDVQFAQYLAHGLERGDARRYQR